jgi:hypothetical protein
MLRLVSMAATAALLLSADFSGGMYLQPPAKQRMEFPPSENLPVLPDMSSAPGQVQATTDSASGNKSEKPKDESLQPMSRLALVRYVDGEFVRAVQPIPAGKKGFHVKVGAPLNEKKLRQALANSGAAVNPGDTAQITSLEFKDRAIILGINGGRRKKRFRDHIQLQIGGVPSMRVSEPEYSVNANVGATLFLDFDEPLPEMTPDDLKQYLSGILDFSKQPSAAVQWVETLPPDMQQAIKEKRAAVGMDREMVLAAIGRPDHRVRERTPDGIETEDWIYGTPPTKTVFVKFEGNKVVQVEQFPR